MKNLTIIVSIIAIVIIAGLVTYNLTSPNKNLTLNSKSQNNNLVVGDQKPGMTIVVDSINLKEAGFITVRKDEGDTPGKIIGVSIPLPQGNNKNIKINLTEETKDGQILYIIAHADKNGNGVLEFPGGDIPIDDNDNILMSKVNIAGSLEKNIVEKKDNQEKNTVAYHNEGFFPERLEVEAGQYVTFVNVSDFDMWIASDPHPSHGALPGFDELTSIKNSGKYSYVFTKPGTWKYHNEMDLSKKGEIVVK